MIEIQNLNINCVLEVGPTSAVESSTLESLVSDSEEVHSCVTVMKPMMTVPLPLPNILQCTVTVL